MFLRGILRRDYDKSRAWSSDVKWSEVHARFQGGLETGGRSGGSGTGMEGAEEEIVNVK